jgi:hypothetical protein
MHELVNSIFNTSAEGAAALAEGSRPSPSQSE